MKSCQDHIELALDMYVDEHEMPPEMRLLTENEMLSTTCEFCQNKAIYVVGN